MQQLEHAVRRKSQFGELAGILVDGVDQFPGVVQAVLGTRRDQAERLFCGSAEILCNGRRGACAFLHAVLECVSERQGCLRGLLDFIRGYVFQVPVHRGHSVRRVLEVFTKIVFVNCLHCALEVVQLLAGGSGCRRHAVHGLLMLRIGLDSGHAHRSGRRRSYAGGHLGGFPDLFRCLCQLAQVFVRVQAGFFQRAVHSAGYLYRQLIGFSFCHIT